jgi:acyl-CoA reductase-like NAD-dependent aldehyde dehydrogenase
METKNLTIAKTIKLFIGGDFPRTESGRTLPIHYHQASAKNKKVYAQACLASRKDLRNAVVAAHNALGGWSGRTAYNRSQILYRMAEMMESKRAEFYDLLKITLGQNPSQCKKAVDESISAFVYYAGFADKYQQIYGAVNPVAGPHHNFTTIEPVGVVGLVGSSKFSLSDFVAQIAAVICSGNVVVALFAESGSALLAPLSEVFATSDLPKGVVNLLTGKQDELFPFFANHMEFNTISVQEANSQLLAHAKVEAAQSMKRVVGPISQSLGLEHLMSYVEFKTVWHPIGG